MNAKVGRVASKATERRGLDIRRPVLIIAPFIILAAIVALRLMAGGPSPVSSTREIGESEPAKVEPLPQAGLHRVVLTTEAAERLGIETAPVREVEVARAIGDPLRKVVPYAAVLYDLHGGTWVYTNPEPRAFIRHRIVVDHIDGDNAVLSEGPPTGTEVVTVGVAELFGTEFGGLVEQ